MSSWTDEIENDLRWREAELGSLKLAVATAPSDTDRQRALLRALWTMLYAHYEGFSKFCWEVLLDQIEKNPCLRNDAIEPLAILSLIKTFQILRGNTSADSIWKFIYQTLPAEMNKPLFFEARPETCSNLWPSLAMENYRAMGLKTERLLEHEQQLKALVGRRNEIAHGKKLVVPNLKEYEIYERSVMIVLHDLAVGVVDLLAGRAYERA